MRGRAPARAAAIAASALLLALPAPRSARGFELLEGRVQLHGFAETRLVGISDDFDDDLDLAQWANVLNLELEIDIAPDGWGPFNYLGSYVRVNVVYDCVWTRACGLAPSADTYGDRANKLPRRLSNRKPSGFTGASLTDPDPGFNLPDQRIGSIRDILPFGPLFDVAPEAAEYVFENFLDYGIASTLALPGVSGPFKPRDFVHPVGQVSDRANPFNANDLNPVTGAPGGLAQPYRPPSALSLTEPFDPLQSRGVYYPIQPLRDLLPDLNSNHLEQNFRQSELAWNRGASQQDEKELKEAYLDFELLDGALWGRVGKQTIVWGKTELFRNQDRWNPSDLGAGPLAGLEEARVPLWAARLVYSFYEVGPVEDVRLELAANYDQFEPVDLGQCGEPVLPTEICAKRVGVWGHGLTGLGLAGEMRPEDPWDDTEGIEAGVRLEWRWDRFSFAITDFYGYDDAPIDEPYFSYRRNVDVDTGRPRRLDTSLRCDPDGLLGAPTVAGCLGDVSNPSLSNPAHVDDVLVNHHMNQQLFAGICAATVGIFDVLDAAACAQTVFNSQAEVELNGLGLGFAIAPFLANGFAGNPNVRSLLDIAIQGPGNAPPFRTLNEDLCDGVVKDPSCPTTTPGNPPAFLDSILGPFFGTLNASLTDQQEALLGCGPFYGSDCEADGVDFLNAEASVLVQSWTSFDGNPTDASHQRGVQAGTLNFSGGPAGTRFENGATVKVVGTRGPFDAGYDPHVDGCVVPAAGPCAGQGLLTHPQQPTQIFANEMAAVSYNVEMLLVALSVLTDPTSPTFDPQSVIDPSNPYADGEEQCSYAQPQYCAINQGLIGLAGLRNALVTAGGNGRYGRRDWLWSSGVPRVLTYDKRNVLGFSLDFAEDRTATNWGVEWTWENDFRVIDAARERRTEVDRYNLTVSMDRPTFVRFLNRSRVFFFNTQWFVRWIDGYRQSFTSNGPWEVLATATVATAYFQDRLTMGVTAVYDFESESSALLQSVGYRFTENFSVSVGLRLFAGRFQHKLRSVDPAAVSNDANARGNRSTPRLGVAPFDDLDHVTLRLRYTF